MRPHPRIRKTIKWGSAAAAVLLSGVWILSECRYVGWGSDLPPGNQVWLQPGRIVFGQLYGNNGEINVGQSRWRFGWHAYFGGTSRMWVMGVPLWPLILATGGVGLGAWALDARAARRGRAGTCAKCGYDRAGIGVEARCPECGGAGRGP